MSEEGAKPQKKDVAHKYIELGADERYKKDDDVLDAELRLLFAKQILLCLFLIIIFVFSSSYFLLIYWSANEKLISVVDTILDITKTVVPSMATLVLGFYFGKKDT